MIENPKISMKTNRNRRRKVDFDGPCAIVGAMDEDGGDSPGADFFISVLHEEETHVQKARRSSKAVFGLIVRLVQTKNEITQKHPLAGGLSHKSSKEKLRMG
jgi:hypothetical protein